MQTSNWREEKQREFFERFGADKIWVKPSRENVETVHEMWAFMLEVEKESIERAIEVLPKPIEPVSSEGVDGYNEAIARSVEALKTLLH